MVVKLLFDFCYSSHMLSSTNATRSKTEILAEIGSTIAKQSFTVEDQDLEKPWGAYFRFAESDLPKFLSLYYPVFDLNQLNDAHQHSPKLLVIAPAARLSWQYHHRRAEIWRCEDGPVGVVISSTDDETPFQRLTSGQIVKIEVEKRHRIVGLDNWAVIAEIWQHTDPTHPSEETDIIRLSDDYHRT
jgi:mannose-6-phosphate isomerase